MWSVILVIVSVPALIAVAVSFVPVPPVPARDPASDVQPASAPAVPSLRRFARCAPERTGDVRTLRPDAPA